MPLPKSYGIAAGWPLVGSGNRNQMQYYPFSTPVVLANNLVAQLGDSRTEQGGQSAGIPTAAHILQPKSRAYGYQVHLANYLRGRARVPSTLNFGLAGDTSGPHGANPGFTSRVDEVIASGAALCSLTGPINDRGSENMTAAESITNMEYCIATLTAANVFVILTPELFKGSASYPGATLTGQQLANEIEVFNWGMSQAGRRNVRVVDPRPLLRADPINQTWVDHATGDGLHPDISGVKVWGYDVIGPQVADLFNSFSELSFSTVNPYNATANPRGNLITNPLLTGTGGTANGNAGTFADNTTMLTAPAGLTIIGTAGVTLNGHSDWQRLQISGTPSTATNPSWQIAVSSPTANILQGDKLSGYFEAYVASASGVLAPCNAVARVTYTTGTPVPQGSTTNEQASNVQGFFDIAPYSWFGMIDEMTTGSGNTIATCTFSITPQVLNGTPCNLDLYIRMPFLGKNQYT